MTDLRAIIVDDELRARRVLRNLLKSMCSDLHIVDECGSVLTAIESIQKHQPDLVFLDIQMPEYRGYELFNMLENINFDVIFVTAYDEYAIKAFEWNALDYLTKPVERERLKQSVERAKQRKKQKIVLKDYNELVSAFETNEIKNIVVNELNSRKVIELDSILSIEGMGAYSKIHFADNSVLTVSKNLKYFQDILDDHQEFYRCHKSWIVSLNKVQSFNSSQFFLMMENNSKVKISRTKMGEIELMFRVEK